VTRPGAARAAPAPEQSEAGDERIVPGLSLFAQKCEKFCFTFFLEVGKFTSTFLKVPKN
jgi:hypothetical protein